MITQNLCRHVGYLLFFKNYFLQILIIHLMVANVEDMPISGNMINDTSLCRHLIKMTTKKINTIIKTKHTKFFNISIIINVRCY